MNIIGIDLGGDTLDVATKEFGKGEGTPSDLVKRNPYGHSSSAVYSRCARG